MTTELKNCPFCGGPAQIMEGHSGFIGRVQVECAHCRVGTFYYEECVAVRTWNKRAESGPSKAAYDADLEARKRVAAALDLPTNGLRDGKPVSFGWEYLIGLIEDAVKVAEGEAAPPSAQAVAQERDAFEKWAKPRWPHPVDWEPVIGKPHKLNNFELQAAWSAWQARAALAAPAQLSELAHQPECDLLKPSVIEHEGKQIAVARDCNCRALLCAAQGKESE